MAKREARNEAEREDQEEQATRQLFPHAVIYGSVGADHTITGKEIERPTHQPCPPVWTNLEEFLWAMMIYWLALEECRKNDGFWTTTESGLPHYVDHFNKKVKAFDKPEETVAGLAWEIWERGAKSIYALKVNKEIRRTSGKKKGKQEESVAERSVDNFDDGI